MKKRYKLYWRLCTVVFILLIATTYSPLITPEGEFHPQLFEWPYSLWAGIAITMALVFLTFLGSQFLGQIIDPDE